MKKYIVLALLPITNLTAQTLHIRNEFDKTVTVIVTGSKLLITEATEKLVPGVVRRASVAKGKTKKIHVDVVDKVEFKQLTDPSTGKPLSMGIVYARFVGAYKAAKDQELHYLITPEGKVATDRETKREKKNDTKK